MKLIKDKALFCSSCFGQYSDRKYVDFDAYWDGPTVNEENNIVVAIDDLIICDKCLEAAASLIGMVNNKQMRKENYELGQALEEKNKELDRRAKIISDLEHTISELLKSDIKRPAGRPTMRFPDKAAA